MRILFLWLVLLTILYSSLSINRHNRYESGGFDLGIYDQAVWQYSRGLIPVNTVKERFILGDHLTLTLPLLAPLFWIWDDVRMLLIFQAAWLTASTIAIYLISRHRGLSGRASGAIGFAYSLFFGIQYAVFFDFHPIIIGVGLLAWFAYFFETRKKNLSLITLILLLLTQENMGLALAALGICYFFTPMYRKASIWFFPVGVSTTLIANRITGWFSPVGYEYAPMIPWSHPVTLVTRLFDTFEKQLVWLYSFTGFAFLPILSAGAVFAILADVSQYFVTGDQYYPMWSPFKHHRAILAVFLALGTMDVFSRIKKPSLVTLCSLVIIGATIAGQYVFHLPLNKLTKTAFWQKEPWKGDNDVFLSSIPQDYAIATQQSLVPHLTHRTQIYLVWPRIHDIDTKPCGQTSCWWLDFNKNAQYLVIDLHPNQWLTQLLETNEHVQDAVRNMENDGVLTLERKLNNIALYRIN